MSKTIDCNDSNELLSNKEWKRIEQACKQKNHIIGKKKIKKIIEDDEKILECHGITFKQLGDLFHKIKAHTNSGPFCKNYEYTLSKIGFATNSDSIDETDKSLCLLYKYKDKFDYRWSLQRKIITKIFNKQFTVIILIWGGAETCPFQSTEDKKYHGYDYGDRDWVIINNKTNESIHIGDLLFHEISKHHFFQDKESKYRIEPEKLIGFFNMQSEKDYETDFIITYHWKLIAFSPNDKKNDITDAFLNLKTFIKIDNIIYKNIIKIKNNEFYLNGNQLVGAINSYDDNIIVDDAKFDWKHKGVYLCYKERIDIITDKEREQKWC